MKSNQYMNLANINYDPNANYILSSQYSPTPIQYNHNLESTKENEERLIPFIGGAVLGGIAGNAFARPNYGYPLYGYGIPYYYPYNGYYNYGGGYLPNTYNNYYYSGYRTTR